MTSNEIETKISDHFLHPEIEIKDDDVQHPREYTDNVRFHMVISHSESNQILHSLASLRRPSFCVLMAITIVIIIIFSPSRQIY